MKGGGYYEGDAGGAGKRYIEIDDRAEGFWPNPRQHIPPWHHSSRTMHEGENGEVKRTAGSTGSTIVSQSLIFSLSFCPFISGFDRILPSGRSVPMTLPLFST